MDPNAAGYPALQQQHNAGYPVTTQSPHGQQFPFYPNAMPSSSFSQSKTPVPQSHQQHSFGPVPLQSGGPGGAMMPSGFPEHPSGPHGNFSAAFTQPPVPATLSQFVPPQGTPTSNMSPSMAQNFTQNMASVSANSMLPAQQSQQQQQQRPVQQPNQQQAPVPAAGQSQAAAAREKARVSTLLDINSVLLQEVVNLQAAGKAGGPPNQQGSQDNNPSPTSDQASDAAKGPTQKPSLEYVECMRRLQANLAYLATIADRAKKSGGVAPAAPAIMTPPPNMPTINELYNKLNELFRTSKGAVGTPQPSPQGTPGNGKPSPSPAAESAV
ncbi:uncharacterized protein CDV56_106959 [Aspergillus thermomutatus]|uniref:Uncharacterized protein n=1 Tax=Aspergillus thermomutatus TaxID=41047 RepID=A0A397H2C0_ASPTH|nr:uncharacterized protein CDV56_106959 [Aspergillus thermomutatus]RHZ57305.1 hypothetical protein CDV56_106959 [Aspergillus thermomutatus]